MLYFTADLHLYHSNIITMSNRPFADVREMNRTLVNNWNACVSNRDEIYILGDFAFKASTEEAIELLQKLNGKKYLIAGNHDTKYLKDPDFVSAFEWVKDFHILDYKDARFILFHYPIFEWPHYFRKSVMLYGHVHNNPGRGPDDAVGFDILGPRAINVGVDCNDYYPVSADAVYMRAFGDT